MKQMEVSLCCGRPKCPKIKVNENDVSIEDDYGNTVYMNESQFDELKHRVKSGEFD